MTTAETESIVDLYRWEEDLGMVVDSVDDGANGICSVTEIAWIQSRLELFLGWVSVTR